jgi:3-deoxy-D-arabino-heptulosonate 7-phosphate (DAHP) synthase
MAQKLGVPFTNDLLKLGSNSAISDALIEKAVAAGKSEEQINAAMASL